MHISTKEFKNTFLKNRGRKGIYDNLTIFFRRNYKKGLKLLDVGCGSCIFTNLAKKIGYDVYAVDYNPDDCVYKNINVIKVDLNSEKLPFDNNFFDIVIMTEVIEHLYNPGFIFSEINRVLKPNGFFYLTTPNIANLKNKLWFLFFSYFLTHKKNPKIGEHITHITPLFLKYFLERFNFYKIEINYLNSFFPFTKIKLPKIEAFSDNVSVISKKKINF